MKHVLIIPGLRRGPLSPAMRRIARIFSRAGFNSKIARIHWSGHSILDWLDELDAIVKEQYLPGTILLGFGEGATLASLIASRQTPGHLVLCAPRSIEKSGNVEPSQLDQISRYSFPRLADTITSPTTFIMSEAEALSSPQTLEQVNSARTKIGDSELIMVPSTTSFKRFYRHAINELALHYRASEALAKSTLNALQ